MTEWKEFRIEEPLELLAVLEKVSSSYAFVYRGQSSYDWGLIPKLQRLLGPDCKPQDVVMWECAIVQNFRRHAGSHISLVQAECLKTMLGTLMLMQHYGAPTRFLDWTFSPWVAAYFATRENLSQDGVIWAFDRDLLSRDAGWQADNDLSEEQIARYSKDFDCLTSAVNVSDWCKKSILDIPVLTTLNYEFADPRISAQQSLFTLCGTIGANHGEELAKRLPIDRRLKIIVPASIKKDLCYLLWKMNVGALTLFPGLDGVGQFVNDAVRCHLSVDHIGIAWLLRETNDGRDLGLLSR